MTWYQTGMKFVKDWGIKIYEAVKSFFGKVLTKEAAQESYGWLALKGAGIAAGTMLLGRLWAKGVDKILGVKEDSGFFKKYILALPLKIVGYVLAALGSALTLGYLPKWLGVDAENVAAGNPRRVTAGGVARKGMEKSKAVADNLLSAGRENGGRSRGKSGREHE